MGIGGTVEVLVSLSLMSKGWIFPLLSFKATSHPSLDRACTIQISLLLGVCVTFAPSANAAETTVPVSGIGKPFPYWRDSCNALALVMTSDQDWMFTLSMLVDLTASCRFETVVFCAVCLAR